MSFGGQPLESYDRYAKVALIGRKEVGWKYRASGGSPAPPNAI